MGGKDLLRALAVTGLLLVTACSAADTPDGRAEGSLRTELTDAERVLLGEAEERLIAACMREAGFQYRLDPAAPRAKVPERRFGLDDVDWARKHGYGLADAAGSGDRGGKSAAPRSSQDRYLATLTPSRLAAYERALNGTKPDAIVVPAPGRGEIFTAADGCRADARRALYGDLRKWTEAKATVVNLAYVTYDDVVAEPRYTEALADWRACMRKRGLDYPDTSRAVGAVAKENNSRTPEQAREREVEVAVADAECNRSAGLSRTGTRLQREHVRDAARHEYARQTRYYTRTVTTALDWARTVTETG
ncbi:hypothetical protein Stsp02_62750 [Streptomyces sp. NBRC 14336]|uniref:hypothetical protein n=1 Tax=Streptomyces sp. NBRC 14336 TaxID=3030992 RepID=UPI0024A0D6D1|nr:hypothetical protein [Streptomyces sp. NBRC 14336]WBO79289.1 hypothetical protein SBE_002981 [Streptomyces sp. SBE_14.2]GLW50614.1 hypothetical protein Stsp02_62750 [Streptomyces sp. NBRC 14336]